MVCTRVAEIYIERGEASMTKEERRAHWRQLIEKSASSGLSAAAFCRQQKISYHQFHWWRRRFRKKDSQDKESGFLQLVPFSKSQDSGIRLRLQNGLSVEVDQGFDPYTLRRVIDIVCSGETK